MIYNLKIGMNKSKYKVITAFLIVGSLSFSSCSDFLEQPEGSVINKEYVFSDPDRAMEALFNVYATCIVDGFITGEGGSGFSDAGCVDGLLIGACDEGDQYGDSHRYHQFNVGTWGPQNQEEFNLTRAIQGMRNASIFIDNVDNVPLGASGSYNWTIELREQVRAEAKVLRALMHFEAFKRFGGIPIMDQAPTVKIESVNGVNKAIVVPSGTRQSVERVVNFIVRSCEEAYPFLKDDFWGTSEYGRVHKGVALALKSKTLLYAASPLFNTDKPYLSYGDERDSLICYRKKDPTLWDKAATAGRQVLDWAKANNYELLDDGGLGKIESYNYASCKPLDPRNKETIYFDRSHSYYSPYFNEKWWNLVRFCCPIYYTWGNTSHAMPMNFLKQFRDLEGNDVELPQEGSFIEFKEIMKKMEPRLQASIWWPGSKYTETGLMDASRGADTAYFVYQKMDRAGNLTPGVSGSGPILGPGVPNGLHFKKFINQVNGTNATLDINWPIFRLSEMYLNYAEALNESTTDRNITEMLNALNEVRVRGGLPKIKNDLGYEDMKKEILRERAVELYAEEHRFFDVRRWLIAGEEGIMKGEFYTFSLKEKAYNKYKVPQESWTAQQKKDNDSWLYYAIEPFENRIWEDKMYLYPFPQDEVNKGIIVQNPGWEL